MDRLSGEDNNPHMCCLNQYPVKSCLSWYHDSELLFLFQAPRQATESHLLAQRQALEVRFDDYYSNRHV